MGTQTLCILFSKDYFLIKITYVRIILPQPPDEIFLPFFLNIIGALKILTFHLMKYHNQIKSFHMKSKLIKVEIVFSIELTNFFVCYTQ